MFIKKKIVLFFIFMFSSGAFAKTLFAYVGSTMIKTDFQPESKVEPQPVELGGFGMKVIGAISPQGNIEIDLFHSNKEFFKRKGPSLLVEQTQMVQFNIGYRRQLFDRLSASLLFASAYSLGQPKLVYRTNAAPQNMDTSASDYTEYGAVFGLQTELYRWERFTAVLDFDYTKSLTSKKCEAASHFGAFVGFKYAVIAK